MFNKAYWPFYTIIVLFLLALIYSISLYIRWDAPVPDQNLSLEVNLPIIDWKSYESLSKQYEDVSVDNGS